MFRGGQDKAIDVTLLSSLSVDVSLQICFGVCAEELPGYKYFGTQYSFEVSSVIRLPSLWMFQNL